MEWSAAKAELTYTPPLDPRAWLDQLDAALGLFLAEKKLLPVGLTSAAAPAALSLATETESLAFLTHQARLARLGLPALTAVAPVSTPLVEEARLALR
jgi:hypothetical protein